MVAPEAVRHAGYAPGFLLSRRVVNKLSDNVFTLPPYPEDKSSGDEDNVFPQQGALG